MNNKGQVLVVFVLIIPLLLLLATYLVDNIYILYNTNKLNELDYLILKDAKEMELTKQEIEDYIYKNDPDIIIKSIDITPNKIEIVLNKEIKSIFGFIIGKDKYLLKVDKSIAVSNYTNSSQ